MKKFCTFLENFDITISAGLTSSALQKMLLKAGGGLSGRTRTISTATPCCKIKEQNIVFQKLWFRQRELK